MASSHTAFDFAIGEEGIVNAPGQLNNIPIPININNNTNKKKLLKRNKLNKNKNKNKNNYNNILNDNTQNIYMNKLDNDIDFQEEEEEGDDIIDDKLLYTSLSYSQTPQPQSQSQLIPFISHSRNNSNKSITSMTSLSYMHSRENSIISYSRQRANSNSSINLDPPQPSSSLSVSIPQSHFYPTPQSSFDSLSSPSDLQKLKKWLDSFGLQNIYKKLIKAGYDSIEIFTECDDDDVKQIAKDHSLSHAEQLKLRKAIKSLTVVNNNNGLDIDNDVCVAKVKVKAAALRRDNSIIITEKEKQSLMEISSYLDNICECYNTIKSQSNLLEIELKNKEKDICNQFSDMFNILHTRKLNLINDLHAIYKQKKDIFDSELNNLNVLINNIRISQKQCSSLILSQSINKYNDDINKINNCEYNIINIKNKLCKTIGPININIKINLNLSNYDIIQIISVLGDVQEDPLCSNQQLIYRPNDNNNNNVLQKQNYYCNHDQKQKQQMKIDSDDDISSSYLLDNDDNISTTSGSLSISTDLNTNDIWKECGNNLLIQYDGYSNYSKIVNIGGNTLNKSSSSSSYIYRGSAYGNTIVYNGVHYWKLKILNTNNNNNNSFAIGFICNKYGVSKRNHSFLSHNQSIGLYNNRTIMCLSKKKSSNGIIMKHKDIINICFDFNNKYIYIQRCEYNKNKKIRTRKRKKTLHPSPSSPRIYSMDYNVHKIKKINIPQYGININSLKNGYRLAAYLRQKGQSITILEYSQKPFDEWDL